MSETNDSAGNGPIAPDPTFQTTHWSAVLQATREESSPALERLCRAYWYPLFAYVRRRGYDEHAAQDLTQAFFERLLTRQDLAVADRERGRFRTFLLSLLSHFLANEWDRRQAQKRGGGCAFVSLDYVREQEDRPFEPSHEDTPERIYERRWAEAVLNSVLHRLREEFDGARVKRFDALKVFLVEEPKTASYAEIAAELGMSQPAVKSAIHRLRQRYGELLRDEIAQTLQSPADIDDELRHLTSIFHG